MKFRAMLPNGETRDFVCPVAFDAYVREWPRSDFFFVWAGPRSVSISAFKPPF